MSSPKGSFASTLTSDPIQRSILGVYQRSMNNKRKTQLLAESIGRHSPEALKTTETFLRHTSLPKSIIKSVTSRMRHDAPLYYATWIRYMADHYNEALALRSALHPQQTYVSLCNVIAGLSQYSGHEQFTKDHRSALLAAVYAFMSNADNSELTYSNVENYVRLTNGELLEFIDEYSEDAAMIKSAMVNYRLVRPAEIEAALDGNTTTLVNGSL